MGSRRQKLTTIKMLTTLTLAAILLQQLAPAAARPADLLEEIPTKPLNNDYQALQALLGQNLAGSPQEKAKVVDLMLQLLSEIDLPTLCEVIASDTNGSFRDVLQVPGKSLQEPHDAELPETSSQVNIDLREIDGTLAPVQNNDVSREQLTPQGNAPLSTNAERSIQLASAYSEDSGHVQELTADEEPRPTTTSYIQNEPNVAQRAINKSNQVDIVENFQENSFHETTPLETSRSINAFPEKTRIFSDNSELLHPFFGKYENSPLNTKLGPAQSARQLKEMHLRSLYRPGDYADNFEAENSVDGANENVKSKSVGIERPMSQLYSKSLLIGDWVNDKNTVYADMRDDKENNVFGEKNLQNSVLVNEDAKRRTSPYDDKQFASNSLEKLFGRIDSNNDNYENIVDDWAHNKYRGDNVWSPTKLNMNQQQNNLEEHFLREVYRPQQNVAQRMLNTVDLNDPSSLSVASGNEQEADDKEPLKSYPEADIKVRQMLDVAKDKIVNVALSTSGVSREQSKNTQGTEYEQDEHKNRRFNEEPLWTSFPSTIPVDYNNRKEPANMDIVPELTANEMTRTGDIRVETSTSGVALKWQHLLDGEQVVQTNDSAPLYGEQVVQTNDSAPLYGEQVVQTNDSTPLYGEQFDQINDSAPLNGEQVVQTNDSAPLYDEHVVQTNDSAPLYGEQVVQTNDSAPLYGEQVVQTNDSAPLYGEQFVQTNDSAPLYGEQFVQTNYSAPLYGEQVVQTNYSAPLYGEQAVTANVNSIQFDERVVTTNVNTTQFDEQVIQTNDSAPLYGEKVVTSNVYSIQFDEHVVQKNDSAPMYGEQEQAVTVNINTTQFDEQVFQTNDSAPMYGEQEQTVTVNINTTQFDEQVFQTNDSAPMYGAQEQAVTVNINTTQFDEQVIQTNDSAPMYGAQEQTVTANVNSIQFYERFVQKSDSAPLYGEQDITANVNTAQFDEQIVNTNDSSKQFDEQVVNINDSSKQFDEQIVNTNDSSKQFDEQVVNTNDSSKQFDEQVVNTNDSSKQFDEQIVNINDSSKQFDEQVANTNDSSKQFDEQIVNINDSSTQFDEQVVNTNDSSKQFDEQVVQTNDSAPLYGEQVAITNEISTQFDDNAVTINDSTAVYDEQVVTVNANTTLSDEQIVQTNDNAPLYSNKYVIANDSTSQYGVQIVDVNDSTSQYGEQVIDANDSTSQYGEQVVAANDITSHDGEQVIDANDSTLQNSEQVIDANNSTSQNFDQAVNANDSTSQYGEQFVDTNNSTSHNGEQVVNANDSTSQYGQQVVDANNSTSPYGEQIVDANNSTSQNGEQVVDANDSTSQYGEHVVMTNISTSVFSQQHIKNDANTTTPQENGWTYHLDSTASTTLRAHTDSFLESTSSEGDVDLFRPVNLSTQEATDSTLRQEATDSTLRQEATDSTLREKNQYTDDSTIMLSDGSKDMDTSAAILLEEHSDRVDLFSSSKSQQEPSVMSTLSNINMNAAIPSIEGAAIEDPNEDMQDASLENIMSRDINGMYRILDVHLINEPTEKSTTVDPAVTFHGLQNIEPITETTIVDIESIVSNKSADDSVSRPETTRNEFTEAVNVTYSNRINNNNVQINYHNNEQTVNNVSQIPVETLDFARKVLEDQNKSLNSTLDITSEPDKWFSVNISHNTEATHGDFKDKEADKLAKESGHSRINMVNVSESDIDFQINNPARTEDKYIVGSTTPERDALASIAISAAANTPESINQNNSLTTTVRLALNINQTLDAVSTRNSDFFASMRESERPSDVEVAEQTSDITVDPDVIEVYDFAHRSSQPSPTDTVTGSNNQNVSPRLGSSTSSTKQHVTAGQFNVVNVTLIDADEQVNNLNNFIESASADNGTGSEDNSVAATSITTNTNWSHIETSASQDLHLPNKDRVKTINVDFDKTEKQMKETSSLEVNQLNDSDLTSSFSTQVTTSIADINAGQETNHENDIINITSTGSEVGSRQPAGDALVRLVSNSDVTMDRLQKVASILAAAKVNLSEINSNLQNTLKRKPHNNDNNAINLPTDASVSDSNGNVFIQEILLSTIGTETNDKNVFRVLNEDKIPSVVTYKNVPSNSAHPSGAAAKRELESVTAEGTTSTYDVHNSVNIFGVPHSSLTTQYIFSPIDESSPIDENSSQKSETSTFSIVDASKKVDVTSTSNTLDLFHEDETPASIVVDIIPKADETSTFSVSNLSQKADGASTSSILDLFNKADETSTSSMSDLPNKTVEKPISNIFDFSNKSDETSISSIFELSNTTGEMISKYSILDLSNRNDEISTSNILDVPNKSDDISTSSILDLSSITDETSTSSILALNSKTDETSTSSILYLSNKTDETSTSSILDLSSKTDETSTSSILDSSSKTDETSTSSILALNSKTDETSTSSILYLSNKTDETSTSSILDSSSKTDETSTSSILALNSKTDETSTSSILDSSNKTDETSTSSILDSSSKTNETSTSSILDSSSKTNETSTSSILDSSNKTDQTSTTSILDLSSKTDQTSTSSILDLSSKTDQTSTFSRLDVSNKIDETSTPSLLDLFQKSKDTSTSSISDISNRTNDASISSILTVSNKTDEISTLSKLKLSTQVDETSTSSTLEISPKADETSISVLLKLSTQTNETSTSSILDLFHKSDGTSTSSKFELSPKDDEPPSSIATDLSNKMNTIHTPNIVHKTKIAQTPKRHSSDRYSGSLLRSMGSKFRDQYNGVHSKNVDVSSENNFPASSRNELVDSSINIYQYDINAPQEKPQAIPYISGFTDWLVNEHHPPKPTPFTHPWKAYNIALAKHKVRQNRYGNGEKMHAPETQLYSDSGLAFDQRESQDKEYLWKARPWPETNKMQFKAENILSNKKVSENHIRHQQSIDVGLSNTLNDQTKLVNRNHALNSQASKQNNVNHGVNFNDKDEDAYYHRRFALTMEPFGRGPVEPTRGTLSHSQDLYNVDPSDVSSWDYSNEDPIQILQNKRLDVNQDESFPSGDLFDSDDYIRYSSVAKENLVHSDNENVKNNLRLNGKSAITTGLSDSHLENNFDATEANEDNIDWITSSTHNSPTPANSVPAPKDYKCPDLFGYHSDPNNCQAFFICSWGMAHRVICPAGTLYNPKLAVCDWAVNVKCLNSNNTPTRAY